MQVQEEDMLTSKKDRYLGDILASDGKIEENLKTRVDKGIGVINQILGHLENIAFCEFFLKWPCYSETLF